MIKIVTDTATGLTREMAARFDIDLVPLVVMFGSETLRDGVDITNEVFLQRLKSASTFPTTSQPPVGDFFSAFEKHLDAGHDVLCITVSSLLSGTYNSAETAKRQLDSDKITLVDSKNVATGQTLIVIEAARMVRQGKSTTEIVARLNKMVDGTRLIFVLDTLEYLVKGGRVSSAAGLFGTLLQMKPILHVREGRAEPLERIRTRKKALARLREIVDTAVRDKSGVHIGVVHTGLLAEAEALAQEFRDKYGLDECMVVEMPPAVAAHAGPGALGAAYYVET
jgi:DegV family protein with EDD domain